MILFYFESWSLAEDIFYRCWLAILKLYSLSLVSLYFLFDIKLAMLLKLYKFLLISSLAKWLGFSSFFDPLCKAEQLIFPETLNLLEDSSLSSILGDSFPTFLCYSFKCSCFNMDSLFLHNKIITLKVKFPYWDWTDRWRPISLYFSLSSPYFFCRTSIVQQYC